MIKAVDITHKYNNDLALNRVNLEIKKGEFVSIIGESGSGKSTLLSILSTLLKPSEGDVIFNDTNYKEIENIDTFRQTNIGFIFQFHYLINYLNVKDNLKIANEKVSEEEINTLLEKLDIQELVNKYPSEISGGQRQRVAIARAMMNKPTVIFADEPTGNLDSKNSLKVFELFKKLSNEGTIIIVATHDLKLAALADTIYEVKDGQL
ncbi:ABC transporter ATP-binding protein [Sulfurospirillum arcachonense]|uniref:ABC transporter ATP-binding protein n=1 Tax=Sulfurospirillum arcachonense TaxID=57666 RepID=UPI00046A5F10|nr:ABC transporter ATP-binding protein [Sulfurospirillum arcachonense]